MNEEENTKEVVKIHETPAAQFVSSMDKLIDEASRTIRGKSEAIKSAGGSVSVNQSGEIVQAAGLFNQKKLNPNTNQEERIGFKEHIITNEYNVECDDVIINKHKLNNKLYELSNYKKILASDQTGEGGIAGKFMMFGTVLTKAWDHSLNRYVLIRRLAAMPMFSPQLPPGSVLEGLKITPNTTRINAMKSEFKNGGQKIESFLNNKTSGYTSESGQKITSQQLQQNKQEVQQQKQTAKEVNSVGNNSLGNQKNSVKG